LLFLDRSLLAAESLKHLMDMPHMSECWGLCEGNGGLGTFAVTKKERRKRVTWLYFRTSSFKFFNSNLTFYDRTKGSPLNVKSLSFQKLLQLYEVHLICTSYVLFQTQ